MVQCACAAAADRTPPKPGNSVHTNVGLTLATYAVDYTIKILDLFGDNSNVLGKVFATCALD